MKGDSRAITKLTPQRKSHYNFFALLCIIAIHFLTQNLAYNNGLTYQVINTWHVTFAKSLGVSMLLSMKIIPTRYLENHLMSSFFTLLGSSST